MTPQEKENIQTALAGAGDKIRIRLRLTDDHRGELLAAFCADMQALVPGMKIEKESHADPLPSMRIADNVSYQAVPLDRELKPFLDFLSSGAADAGRLILPEQKIPEQKIPDQIRIPAKLTVFISAQCPFCPQAAASALMLAAHCRLIHVTVVDGTLFPELAKEAQVRSVPAVILDSRFRWTGTVDPHEIADIIVSRDPSQLSAATLQQMIEEGKAEELSAMMADSEKVFPGVIDLLTHPKWPVRLGAMVVFEYLNENSGRLALEIMDRLWEKFDAAPDDIKGDIIYLSGESNRVEVIGRLEAVQNGKYADDVREAAAEALSGIKTPLVLTGC